MNWLALTIVAAMLFGQSGDNGAKEEAQRRAQEESQRTERINELAGNIRSEQDARAVVDLVAQTFEKDLPPAWSTAQLRERVARAEFRSVTDSKALISDERLAQVWNEYVKTIGAPDVALTNAAEI